MIFSVQPVKIAGMVYVVSERANKKKEECVHRKTKELQKREVIRAVLVYLFALCQA